MKFCGHLARQILCNSVNNVENRAKSDLCQLSQKPHLPNNNGRQSSTQTFIRAARRMRKTASVLTESVAVDRVTASYVPSLTQSGPAIWDVVGSRNAFTRRKADGTQRRCYQPDCQGIASVAPQLSEAVGCLLAVTSVQFYISMSVFQAVSFKHHKF